MLCFNNKMYWNITNMSYLSYRIYHMISLSLCFNISDIKLFLNFRHLLNSQHLRIKHKDEAYHRPRVHNTAKMFICLKHIHLFTDQLTILWMIIYIYIYVLTSCLFWHIIPVYYIRVSHFSLLCIHLLE